MRHKITTLRCPTCRKLVVRTDPEFPFCSERCRLVDLGKWASGAYVITTPMNDPEALESSAGERRPSEGARTDDDDA